MVAGLLGLNTSPPPQSREVVDLIFTILSTSAAGDHNNKVWVVQGGSAATTPHHRPRAGSQRIATLPVPARAVACHMLAVGCCQLDVRIGNRLGTINLQGMTRDPKARHGDHGGPVPPAGVVSTNKAVRTDGGTSPPFTRWPCHGGRSR